MDFGKMDEENDLSDGDLDDKRHDDLIGGVLSLNAAKRTLKKPTRTEPTLRVSEFNLVKSLAGKQGNVYLEDLTRGLKSRSGHVAIRKRVENAGGNAKTLPKPLEKPQAERIRRTIVYEKARLGLDRWEAFVTSNRATSHLRFPFDSNVGLKNSKVSKCGWRLKSELQKKLETVEAQVVTIAETEPDKHQEESAYLMTPTELKERRKEMAKLRAHQSYREAKARKQSKIKSKSYHRAQRREKIKQKIKEFELLQKNNPEKALIKLNEIEKVRAEERMSLRHRGTGKWARSKQIRAKYDKDTRKVLAEQLKVSRDLTQKVRAESDESSDGNQENGQQITSAPITGDNPWQGNLKPSKEVEDFVTGYRKFWQEKNGQEGRVDKKEAVEGNEEIVSKTADCGKRKINRAMNIAKKMKNGGRVAKKIEKPCRDYLLDWKVTPLDEEELDKMFDKLQFKLRKKLQNKYGALKNSLDEKGVERKRGKIPTVVGKKQKKSKTMDLSFPSIPKRPVIDEALEESHKSAGVGVLREKTVTSKSPRQHHQQNIDPDKFIEGKPVHLENNLPDLVVDYDNEEEDDENNQKNLIMEAFEDDDIANEFGKEKSEEVKRNNLEDVNLTLPGWGSWGGKNLKISRRKSKRFILKFPKEMPRRDKNRRNLVVNERANKNIKVHQVSELPFPFKTVKDFEASIRAPLGNTFVPETAFRRFTRPAVTTKMGAVIEPADEKMLLKKPKVA